MPYEIERKYLVTNDTWKQLAEPVRITQGYMSFSERSLTRVRLAGATGWLTVKGRSEGISRREYEYEIPADHAKEMLEHLCGKPLIEKLRYRLPAGDLTWEVDEFFGDNEGLIVAEIELPSENHEFPLPDWVGMEVTDDYRYANTQLVKHPFKTWGHAGKVTLIRGK